MSPSRTLQYTIVDAFTDAPFSGNPASVIVLDKPLEDKYLQLIAREFNLSETAYITILSSEPVFTANLRWFTPRFEITLCGHATLASAHVLFSAVSALVKIPEDLDTIRFRTLSGDLNVRRLRDTGHIELEFPAAELSPPPESLSTSKVASVIAMALGLDAESDNLVQFVGCGTGISFDVYILIHIRDDIDLESIKPHPSSVVSTIHFSRDLIA
jgi:PhzF family phenazine biosynthesis protein